MAASTAATISPIGRDEHMVQRSTWSLRISGFVTVSLVYPRDYRMEDTAPCAKPPPVMDELRTYQEAFGSGGQRRAASPIYGLCVLKKPCAVFGCEFFHLRFHATQCRLIRFGRMTFELQQVCRSA